MSKIWGVVPPGQVPVCGFFPSREVEFSDRAFSQQNRKSPAPGVAQSGHVHQKNLGAALLFSGVSRSLRFSLGPMQI